MKPLFAILIAAVSLQFTATSAQALIFGCGRNKCESTGDFEPPKSTFRISSRRISTEWETRYDCLTCGNKVAYRVRVATYRDRYSNGVQRTWKCVLEHEDQGTTFTK